MKCPRCFFTDRDVPDEICRRCSRNFSRRELVHVILLGLFYLFLCRFSYYVFTGDFFSHVLKGGMFFPIRMSDMFDFPVSLAEHPWHVLTVGWLFTLVLLVPMLVGLFYGAVPGVIVALIGAYHVPAPFFFLLVMLSALIAGTRTRNLLHLEASLFLGIVPPMVYLFVLTLPAFLGKLGALAWVPWLVTILTVSASVSPALWLARRRDYNTSFLPWVVGVQAVLLVVLFHSTIGFATVEYEFVRRKYWSGGPRFRIVVPPVDARHSSEEQHAVVRGLFERRREQALREFSRFISWFPRSSETPRALFERAELFNLRAAFPGTRPNVLHPYTTRITPEALEDYKTIRTDFSGSAVTVEARLRMGRFSLQHHRLGEARQELLDLRDFCDVRVPRDYTPPEGRSVLGQWRTRRLSTEEHRQFLYEVLAAARADLAFLEANADYNRLPLMLFCQLDPHTDDHESGLGVILRWFDDCLLVDNIRLTLLERRSYELEMLEALLEEHPKGDVAPRMLWLLGSGYYDRMIYTRADRFLKRLVGEFPASPEAEHARKLLLKLPAGKTET